MLVIITLDNIFSVLGLYNLYLPSLFKGYNTTLSNKPVSSFVPILPTLLINDLNIFTPSISLVFELSHLIALSFFNEIFANTFPD